MFKTTVKYLLSFTFFAVFAASRLFGQTITIGSNGGPLDAGPYAPGSNIAVPFHVDQTGGCINRNNRYELYMSDAAGVFDPAAAPVAFTDPNTFYATYINYTLPVGTTVVGGLYRFMVKATSPGVSSSPSNPITVIAGTPATAGAGADASISPDKFGQSSGPRPSYTIFDGSTPTATTSTVSIFNETTQSFTVQNQSIKNDFDYLNVPSTNFTVIAKATNGLVISTKAYELVNNVVNSSIAVQGNGTICLNNGVAPLVYSVSTTGNNRVQLNYPGNLYRFSWGDNNTDELTLCQILASNGDVTHPYTRASCGNSIAGHNNSFQIDITIRSAGSQIGGTVTSYAVILQTPINLITSSSNLVCFDPVLNTTGLITFRNGSVASADPLNTSTPTCAPNPNARYIWLVDGQIKATNYVVSRDFQWEFITNGPHTVTLREQVGNGGACQAVDYTYNICVQKPAIADFTLPAGPVCIANPVAPVDASTLDLLCNTTNNIYNWSVSPATFNYASGNATSVNPQFRFLAAGVYTVSLNITTTAPGGCTSNTVTKTIIVDATPTIQLASNTSYCGKSYTLTFDNTAGSKTRTIFAGTPVTGANTYTWTVTGGAYSFAGGTDNHSQNPQIYFDNFATYTVAVTHTNSCGTETKQQTIQFINAPTVDAGLLPPVCEGSGPIHLTGIVVGVRDTVRWTIDAPSTGTLTTPESVNTDYIPSAADFQRGYVTLKLHAYTPSADCSDIVDGIVIRLIRTTTGTSATAKTICSGGGVNYTITTNNDNLNLTPAPVITYNWTGTVTTGTVDGVTGAGTSKTISDILINRDPTVAATVTYHITPITDGCAGTPFDFVVTIPAVPIAAPTYDSPTICSGAHANINLITNQPPAGVTYIWTVAQGAVTGGVDRTTRTSDIKILDALTNNTNGVVTVTYTITPYNSDGCPGAPVPISVDVNPATPAAIAGPAQILCNMPGTTLAATTPLAPFTGMWTQPVGQTATIDNPTSATTTVSGLVGGINYSFIWTISSPYPCGSTTSTVVITNRAATVGGTTSGADTVCAGSNSGTIALAGRVGNILRWESSTNGGPWTTIANSANNINITYSGLTQTTQYRAVVRNGIECAEEVSTVTTIKVNPPVPPAVVGANQVLCDVTTTTLNATAPGGAFVGQWSQTGGPAATITDINDPHTTVTSLIGDNDYIFTWTIIAEAPCTNNSAFITIRVNLPTVAGNTIGNTTVCAGDNNGQVTLTGHHGRILYWERSENTGTTWTRVNITTANISYSNITQTTQYRAYVQNGNCDTLLSPLALIRVNQPPPPSNAGPNQILCNQPSVTLTANDPGTFVGTWTQISGPMATITNPNSFQTTVTGLTGASTYVFRWTITALAPCIDTFDEVTITNNPDVVASFTANTKVGCGNLTVQFTNTSNNQTGANFIWNFGDGQTSTQASPQHTFAQRTDGRDTTYYISLGVVGNCVQRPAIVDSILVRPAIPIPRILPASTAGCGNYAIDIRNTSPGNNVSYVFYLYDGNTLLQTITKTDKTNAVFDPISTTARKVFTVYMVATGYCNNPNETTHIPVTISPSDVVAQMVIQGGTNAGCAPLNTTFVNNSFGGDNFYYNIYDGNNNLVDRPVAGTTPLPYTFSRAGTYYVTLTAISNCGSNESTRTRVDVYATPAPAFVADITTACKDALITFTNNTISNDPNTPVTSLLYDWDFGDGSAHSALFAPTHAYHFTGTSYTVTLRATNTTSGCTDILVRTSYIVLGGPPKTAFSVRPDSVTSIPNYSFSFIDQTPADAVSWRWTFGDGQTSTRRNPIVTYADTGVYRVTLTTANASGCDSTITKTVRIGGVPGQLFLPNAFMPESATNDLRTFTARGSGIKTWHLQIFNNYGQLVWQTTKLNARGEPEDGWDGTFKGMPAPQGVYQWQASATFINGTEWKGNSYKDELPKRVGSVHLIR